jgi:hypothetical protein
MALPSSQIVEPADSDLPDIELLTRGEGRALFDARAREWLGMSGDEFIRAWEAGEIEDPDRSDVMVLVLMMPMTH